MLLATQDTIDNLETRPAPGLDDVDAGAMATVAPAFVFDRDRYLALRIFADRRAVKLEVLEYEYDTGRLFKRSESGSNRPIAMGGLTDLCAVFPDEGYR